MVLKNSLISLLIFTVFWPQGTADEDQDDQNKFIDGIFVTISREINNMTSLNFPCYEHHFDQHSSVIVQDAEFLGLESITRDGDADVHGTEDGSALVINCDLTIGGLKGRFSSTLKILKANLRTSYDFSLKRVRLRIGLFYMPGETCLNIAQFSLNEFKGMSISVSGLGPLNPIVEKMLTITSDILENLLARYIGETVERFSKQKVYYIPFSP